jgi:hypothetical protein
MRMTVRMDPVAVTVRAFQDVYSVFPLQSRCKHIEPVGRVIREYEV